MSDTPNTKQRIQPNYSQRIGAFRDPHGHLVSFDENNAPIPNDPQTGKPILKPGQRTVGQSPIHTMAQNEGIKPFTPFGGVPFSTPSTQSPQSRTPSPTAQPPNDELAFVPKQSIAQRAVSLIPSATMDKLAAQKAQAAQAQIPIQAGLMPIDPRYATPGGDQFARVTPGGGAPSATAGRIVDETGDRTAQFSAGGSGSSQLATQAQPGQVIRPRLDLNIQKELVKQYPNLADAKHPDNRVFLNAYTKAYDPNKPMTKEQVLALTGGLFPGPNVNIASTKPDFMKEGLLNHPEIKPDPGAVPQSSLLDDVVNSFTGTPYGQSAIDNALNRLTGAGGLKNPSGFMFPSTPAPAPTSTPFELHGSKTDIGGGVAINTPPRSTPSSSGGFDFNNPTGATNAPSAIAISRTPQGEVLGGDYQLIVGPHAPVSGHEEGRFTTHTIGISKP